MFRVVDPPLQNVFVDFGWRLVVVGEVTKVTPALLGIHVYAEISFPVEIAGVQRVRAIE